MATIDSTISRRVFLLCNKLVPRTILKLLEHSGNGLFWIPAAAAASLYKSEAQPAFDLWAGNLLLALMLDLA
eukprot:CAMPEP_0177608246 /NCGR_PEP_ID=MMETSP0419_2-20121207/18363_1 /TAXON_ID=582737 /ORGANISM="Tetraselmis sp., Strain GSL018" /LENGTH=71 /DNA_ID=CAMNT_0019102911 /DNA_START=49 /DNA_END=260 /DNA_ORIENTATION=-